MRHPGHCVGVIDVGSNTVRLLVATLAGEVLPVRQERAQLGLGEEVERLGRISPAGLERAASVVRSFARSAREAGAERLQVIVTSPGRQAANGKTLARVVSAASGAPARILSAQEEGQLAWEGAVTAARPHCEPVAVVDVGGGSTQVVVGTLDGGPAWSRSLDLGSLRLTARSLSADPPGKKAIAQARDEARAALDGFLAPLPRCALAVGGSARALRKVAGSRTLGTAELAEVLRILRKTPAAEVAETYGITLGRARTLAAGTILLSEVQRRLGDVELEVARAGLREGAALALLSEASAA